jgi:hypothetical protein
MGHRALPARGGTMGMRAAEPQRRLDLAPVPCRMLLEQDPTTGVPRAKVRRRMPSILRGSEVKLKATTDNRGLPIAPTATRLPSKYPISFRLLEETIALDAIEIRRFLMIGSAPSPWRVTSPAILYSLAQSGGSAASIPLPTSQRSPRVIGEYPAPCSCPRFRAPISGHSSRGLFAPTRSPPAQRSGAWRGLHCMRAGAIGGCGGDGGRLDEHSLVRRQLWRDQEHR